MLNAERENVEKGNVEEKVGKRRWGKAYIENTEIYDVESKRPVAGKGRKEKIDQKDINRNFYCGSTKW